MADAPRRAEELASRIERDIEAAGWPVDQVLGSEPQLLERYGVGRSVFREAVRLLEHHSVARMRAGRNGGLVVVEPRSSAVVAGAALLLRRAGVRPLQLLEARRAVELAVVRLAAERLTEAGVEALRAELADAESQLPENVRGHASDFHRLVASLSGNPVLSLFTEILTRLTRERIAPPDSVTDANREVLHGHRQIAEAIIAGDAALAQHRMNRHFDAIAAQWERSTPELESRVSSTFLRPRRSN